MSSVVIYGAQNDGTDSELLIGRCINDEVALFKNTFVVLFSRNIINCVLELFITLKTMVSLILIKLSCKI